MNYGAAEKKALGAYYTDERIARVIASWALTTGARALDPSCGDGVFLSAASRVVGLRGSVVGVELSELQARETARRFKDVASIHVVSSDFFDYQGAEFDAVIGNPPFIRYQSFSGPSREKAIFRCAQAGVSISKLTSSWAPFVICSGEMLAEGGRLGFVLPTELLHAGYAKPVLNYLNTAFESVTIVTFRERLFPELSQDTLLMLASGKGRRCNSLLHVEAQSIESVDIATFESNARSVDPQTYLSGARRMKETLVEVKSAAILHDLLMSGAAHRLGAQLRADIGYVTGANEFFHLSEIEARRRRIPPRFLSPTVYRGKSLSGLAYTTNDWLRGHDDLTSGYLLRIPPNSRATPSLERYLAEGVANQYHERYKCRVRSPWYSVPHVYWPHGFLTSMSGERPSIVVNKANVLACNSLHILRSVGEECDIHAIALSWLSSITSLSIEIEGHALGGGMLKLEPTEAERVIVVDLRGMVSRREFSDLDRLIRRGKIEECTTLIDEKVTAVTGISRRAMERIRHAAADLRQRRMRRPR